MLVSFTCLRSVVFTIGLQVAFVSGVYGACIGFTHQLKNSTELIPLVGFCNGMGQFISMYLHADYVISGLISLH